MHTFVSSSASIASLRHSLARPCSLVRRLLREAVACLFHVPIFAKEGTVWNTASAYKIRETLPYTPFTWQMCLVWAML